jgi:hypothetical protein
MGQPISVELELIDPETKSKLAFTTDASGVAQLFEPDINNAFRSAREADAPEASKQSGSTFTFMRANESVGAVSFDPVLQRWRAARAAEEKARRDAENAARQAALFQVLDGEASTGECLEDHATQLHQIIRNGELIFGNLRSSLYMTRTHAEMLPMKHGETYSMRFRSVLGGEVHAYVIGFSDTTAQLHSSTLGRSRYQSPYGAVVNSGASAVLPTSPGDEITVEASGRGCTLVLVFVKR